MCFFVFVFNIIKAPRPEGFRHSLPNTTDLICQSQCTQHVQSIVCLFVCFIALRPKSTAMVIAGRSVHLTTLFPGQA